MAAITITRGRENFKPGHKVYRGVGTWNSTDTTGTLAAPKGPIIGCRFTPISSTAVSMSVDATQTGGTISGTVSGSIQTLNLVRSAGTDSGGSFFFEIEYDSL